MQEINKMMNRMDFEEFMEFAKVNGFKKFVEAYLKHGSYHKAAVARRMEYTRYRDTMRWLVVEFRKLDERYL